MYGDNGIKNEAVEGMKSENNQNDAVAVQNEKENEQKNDQEYEKNVKNKILDASLNYVSEHGWTKQAIIAGKQFYSFNSNRAFILIAFFVYQALSLSDIRE